MTRLAVGARPQTPSRQGYDLHVLVLSDLGKIQEWQFLLGKQLNTVSFERLLHYLDHSVDLRDSNHTHVLQPLDVPVALRHAPRHYDWLLLPLGGLHEATPCHYTMKTLLDELLLTGVLDCARVEQTRVCLLHLINQPESVVGQEPRHVLAIADVVRATVCLHEYFLSTRQTRVHLVGFLVPRGNRCRFYDDAILLVVVFLFILLLDGEASHDLLFYWRPLASCGIVIFKHVFDVLHCENFNSMIINKRNVTIKYI